MKKWVLMFMTIVGVACNEPKIPTEFTMSSATYSGFSFERMNVVKNAFTTDIYTDFTVIAGMDVNGKLTYPFLSQLQLKSYFIMSKQFDNLQSAQDYYDKYTVMSENESYFDINAMLVQPFQVWIVKTNTNKYGKILILSTNTSLTNNTPYSEVKFKAELLK